MINTRLLARSQGMTLRLASSHPLPPRHALSTRIALTPLISTSPPTKPFHTTIHRTMSTPPPTAIPLATLGANAEFAQQIQALLLPEYDLVHICTTPDTATTEFPPLCAGALDTIDTTGFGSNAARPVGERRVPRAIIFGGGIADEDVEKVMESVRARAEGVKVVRVTRADVLAKGATGPSPGVIGVVLREKLGGMVEAGEL